MEFIQANPLAVMAVGIITSVAVTAYALRNNASKAASEEEGGKNKKEKKSKNDKNKKKDQKKKTKEVEKEEEDASEEEVKEEVKIAPKVDKKAAAKKEEEEKVAAAKSKKEKDELEKMKAKMAEMEKLLAKAASTTAAAAKAKSTPAVSTPAPSSNNNNNKPSTPAAAPGGGAGASSGKKQQQQPQQQAPQQTKQQQQQPAQQQQATGKQGKQQQQPVKQAPAAVVHETKTVEAEPGWEIIAKKEKKDNTKAPSEAKQQTHSAAGAEILHINPDLYGKIIGPKGETLRKLMAAADVNIEIPKAGNSQNYITIEGTPQNRAIAKQAMMEQSQKGYCKLLDEDTTDSTLTIADDKQGFIIGAKGAFLKAMESKTGCKIQLPNRDETDKVKKTKVKIIGPAAGVKEVITAVHSLIQYGYSDLTHEGWAKIEVDFPSNFAKSLVGPKGQTIRSIQGNTGCRITTSALDKSGKVTVCGPAGKLAQAKKEILRVKDKCEEGSAETECADGFDDADDSARDNLW